MAVQDTTRPEPPPAEFVRRTTLSFKVLGVRVDAVQIPDVVAEIERWIAQRGDSRYIAVTGMHGVTEALQDHAFRRILNSSGLVVPDGMPLVWLGRRHGFGLKRRVYGPELMETLCRETGSKYRHFFYGGMPGVPNRLAEMFNQKYGMNVVGIYSPPFRPLNDEEEAHVRQLIDETQPDILWVGLSTPKQERWMHGHRHLPVPVMIGVGAAFDLNSGNLQQAPRFMRENGMEWLFRLVMEPRRLWRRYLIQGSRFGWNVSLELLGLKAFE